LHPTGCNINNIPCVQETFYKRNSKDFDITFVEITRRDKLYNAFSYLFWLIMEDPNYISYDDDPFANENFKKTLSYITGIKSSEKVNLTRETGVFYVDVEIFGIKKKFVLDSGASEISLSQNFERELIASGLLKKEDYLEPALYRIADGSIIAQRRVLIREIKIGDFAVKNVSASIGKSNIPLLLGKSFLDKFTKWSIDNENNILFLER
jgi:aspartyl protease family protein